MRRIALFASGSGTNAENIIHYFKNSKNIEVSLLLSNNQEAFALERARRNHIATAVFGNDEFKKGNDILKLLHYLNVEYIILAGFLRKIPTVLLENFANKIINIHPALLPKYGGKGMYGMNVHMAVLKDECKKSGISIHLVNEFYDEGQVLFQAECPVLKDDTAEMLAQRINELEHQHFPIVIEKWINEED